MPEQNKVTARDVARRCGVSTTTVYEIVGKAGHRYNAQTREEVLAAAAALGFRPNAAARAMASGRFGMIGVIASYGGVTAQLHTDILGGIEDEAARLETSVVFARVTQRQGDRTERRLINEDFVDGCIVLPDLTLDQLRRLDVRVPMVYVNYKQELDSVYPDEVGAGRRATDLLLASGCADVVYAGFAGNPHTSAMDRREGYIEAMLAVGRQPHIARQPADPAGTDWPDQARAWLAGLTRPVGVLTYDLGTAVAIVRAARELGWQVPADLRVIAFGGPEIGSFRWLPIAGLVVPQAEMGRAAMRLLSDRIAAPQQPLPSVSVSYDKTKDMVTPEMHAVLSGAG